MMLFKSFAAASLAVVAVTGSAFAAGSSSSEPKPKTVYCSNGKVYSESARKCVVQKDSSLTDDDYFESLRSLAYAGENAAAQNLLAMMSDQNADRVLTYWGFTHRRLGNVEEGMRYYNKALVQNPDNILARSYMGQAHVEAGRLDLARVQLKEIRDRGGEGSWPEIALAKAIQSGDTFNY